MPFAITLAPGQPCSSGQMLTADAQSKLKVLHKVLHLTASFSFQKGLMMHYKMNVGKNVGILGKCITVKKLNLC